MASFSAEDEEHPDKSCTQILRLLVKVGAWYHTPLLGILFYVRENVLHLAALLPAISRGEEGEVNSYTWLQNKA